MSELPESIRRLWGVPAHNDLPPLWDGVPVTWRGWTAMTTTIALHLPVDQLACDKCGAIGESAINWGTRHHKAGQQTNIWAARCQHCGQDTVHDTTTRESWDLDETDYGETGSYTQSPEPFDIFVSPLK